MLQRVTGAYKGLQEFTRGCKRLQGYIGLLPVRKGFRGDKGLQGVTKGYRGLQVVEGLQGVT